MIERISMEPPNLIAYIIDGDLSKQDVERVHRDLRRLFETHESIQLYLDIRALDTMSPQAVIEDLKLLPEYLRKLERVAIVGDKDWHAWFAKLSDAITRGKMRYFPPEEATRAQNWLRQG